MKGTIMTAATDTILRGHLLTVALSCASHPRVLIEVMRGHTDRARLALTHQIEARLEATNDPEDDWTVPEPAHTSAEVLNNMPGPLLRSNIKWVVEAVIPD
jgi:hypothetical protein